MLNLLLFIKGILYCHRVVNSFHDTWGRWDMINCFLVIGGCVPFSGCLKLRCVNSFLDFFIKWFDLNFGDLRPCSCYFILITIDYFFHFFFDLVKALFRLWMVFKMNGFLDFWIGKTKLRWTYAFESTLYFILKTLINLSFLDFGYCSFDVSYDIPLSFWPSCQLIMWFQNRLFILHTISNLLAQHLTCHFEVIFLLFKYLLIRIICSIDFMLLREMPVICKIVDIFIFLRVKSGNFVFEPRC